MSQVNKPSDYFGDASDYLYHAIAFLTQMFLVWKLVEQKIIEGLVTC